MIRKSINKIKELQFTRFILVGVLTNILDLLTFVFLISINVNYLLADTIKVPIILLFNFFAHKSFTYKSEGKYLNEVTKYILNVIFLYVISIGILYLLVDKLHLATSIAKVIQLICIMLFNYFILKRIVFRK